MKSTIRLLSVLLAASAFGTACGSSSTEKKETTKEVAPAVTIEKKQVAQTPPTTAPDTPKNQATASNKAPETKKPLSVKSTKFIEGKHYVRISPEMQTDAAPGKVEVIELMWLGCPHCYTLEPTMLKYKKNHPDFIEFKQIPAMLNPSWAADAKTYYLAEILDPTGEKELVTQIFQAIHEQKRRLRSPDAVMRLFKQFGYTEQQVNDVLNSMALQTKLKRAQEIGNNSRAESVPVVIINGKYRTSVYMTGSEGKLLEVMKMLTEREQKK